jgi:EAL domain-containing protein (putative c-di-GMP-specific phosphodiesterase class I)
MGGDEFMILVDPSSGAEQLVDLARVIVSALAGTVQVGVHRLQVTASVGVAEQVATTTSPAELIQAADVTLRWAKADGRARWAIFDPERHAEQSARHRLAGEMSGAIDHDEFVLEYQPLVGLGDHEVRGVEALVRWLHPRLGLLSPDRFIGLAEESGLIVRLGLWILRRACAEAARWRREHPERSFFVSVNLAVRQVHEPNLVDEVASILRETGLAASDLQLELTESAVMGTGGEPLQALWRLAEMGVRIAIDDFGTGYSNLAYLRHLPVHALKLAGPFVEGLRHTGPESSTDERIVENVIRLAHDIGLGVTAEAVETRVQLDRLAALGCDLAQGWYLARALPADEVTAVLRSGLPIVP